MKRLLTAAVAATLMCGVSAYAQDTQTAPAGGSSMAAPTGPTTGGPATGADTPTAPTGPDNGAAPAGAPASAASAAAPDASAAPSGQATNTPDGTPPSSYPRCTSKGQDRCVQGGSMTTSHHMAKHHRKSKTPA